MREETMARTKIDDAPAAKQPARPPRCLPGLVELFTRQAAGMTDFPAQPIEESVAGEPAEVVIGQASA